MTVDYLKAKHCAIACQESYKPFGQQRFTSEPETIIPLEDPETDTQCVLLVTGSKMTIVFRGSTSLTDWLSNFNIRKCQKVYPYADPSQSDVRLHRGFSRSYFSVREQIQEQIKQRNIREVTVTGHSLGGALAIICVVDVQYHFAEQLQMLQTYTFGAPRVGNRAFTASYEARVPRSYRFTNGRDPVVVLPGRLQGYPDHVETQLAIGQTGFWRLLIALFTDHAIANYIRNLGTQAG